MCLYIKSVSEIDHYVALVHFKVWSCEHVNMTLIDYLIDYSIVDYSIDYSVKQSAITGLRSETNSITFNSTLFIRCLLQSRLSLGTL